MGWNSSYLGNNVVSSYLHIDNLRMDLVLGRFWDSGGSKYLQTGHNGTDGTLTSSSGRIHLVPAGYHARIYDPTGTSYINFQATAAESAISSGSGYLGLRAATGDVRVCANGLNNRVQIFASNGTDVLRLDADGMKVDTTTSSLTIDSASHVVTVGASGAASKLKLYDAGAGAWKNLYINNGTVSVENG